MEMGLTSDYNCLGSLGLSPVSAPCYTEGDGPSGKPYTGFIALSFGLTQSWL